MRYLEKLRAYGRFRDEIIEEVARRIGELMVTVNIREAKAQLSKLVDQAVKGEAFVIAKAGMGEAEIAALFGSGD
jgi:hypothetical protein